MFVIPALRWQRQLGHPRAIIFLIEFQVSQNRVMGLFFK